jgi:hypothetical protein
MKNRFVDIRLSELPSDFVRLAGDILRDDPAQLGAQLAARLDPHELAALSPHLQALAASAPVQLLQPSVGQVGGSLIATWSTKTYLSHGVLDGNDTLYFPLDDMALAAWNLDRDWAPHLVASPGAQGICLIVYNPCERALAFALGGDVLLGERSLPIHNRYIQAMAISADGQAVSIDCDYRAKLWDTATGRILLEFETPEDPRRHRPDMEWPGTCTVHQTAARVLCHDGVKAYCWSLQTGALCWSQGVDSLNEGAFAVSPNGRVALVDSTLFDVEGGRPIAELDWSSTRQAAFSHDGSRLYTTRRHDPRIYIREPIMGETLDTFLAGQCRQLLVDSKGRIATISLDLDCRSFNLVQWWDPAGRKAARPTHVFPVKRSEGDRNGAIQVKYGQWPPSPSHTEPAVKMPVPKRGEFLSGTGRYGLRVYADAVVHEVPGNPPSAPKFDSMDFCTKTLVAPGGQFALYIKEDTGAMSLWDMADEREIPLNAPAVPWNRDDAYRNLYALSPDGTHLAIARALPELNHRSTIEVWNLRDGFCYRPVYFSHDICGLQLASGGRCGVFFTNEDGLARFECTEEGVCSDGIDQLAPPPIECVAMTSDGRRAVAVGANRITVCDLERRCRIATFSGDHRATSCAISDDGSLIAVEDRSGRVHYLSVTL